MNNPLNDQTLDQIFRQARTHSAWNGEAGSEVTLRALADLVKMGPTSANCLPARIVFVLSKEAKAKLEPHLMGENRAKTMSAPATAIIGYDLDFHEHLPRLFPHADAKSWFAGNDRLIRDTAFRNSSLQGAYLIVAARALGLDCGPMSGFDNDGVDKAFFEGTNVKSNFLCNIGYGDPAGLFPRSPRFSFEEFCRIE